MEPIDIDINMNQNVSEEASKAASANDEMTKSVDALQKDIERLNKVIQDMSTALAEQKKLTAESGGECEAAAKKIETMQAVLDKTKQDLDAYQGTCEQMNKAVQQGADVTDVLTDAKASLSDTESTLVDTAKELINNQQDVNTLLDQGDKSSNVYSTSNLILSGAIKGVCDALSIENAQVRNSISSVKVIDAVKKAWAKTSAVLTTELGMTAAASKTLMLTGVGLLIAGIASLVILYNRWNEKQKEATRLQQELRKFQVEATASVQEQISKVQILEKVLKDSNNTYSQRNKALNEIKSILPEYNALLSKEGQLIDDNTGALKRYVEQLKNTALAKGAMDKYVAAQNELTQRQAETISPEHKALYDTPGEKIFNDPRYSDNDRWIWAAYHATLEKEEANVKLWAAEVEKYTKENIDTVVENTKAYWARKQEQAYAALERLTPDDKKRKSAAWLAAQKAYDEATDKLKTWDIKGQHRADEKAETAAEKEAKQQEKAFSSLEKKAYEYQKRIDDARVKAIHDGADKERQAARAEYDETRAFIEKEYAAIAKLEEKTKKPATQQRTMLLALDVEATRQYETEVNHINVQSKKTIDAIFSEVSARFASELQQNIADINRYYDELIIEATKAGATIEEVNRLQDDRQKDISRAGVNDELRQADLDEALEMEKANNLASVGLVAIAEETKLEIVKKYLEQRIDLLKKLGDESSRKEADILEQKLKGLQSSPKSINGLVNGALFTRIAQGFEKVGFSASEADEKTRKLFGSFQKGGAQASVILGEIGGMFGGISEDFDQALNSLGSIAEGFATGGIAGGVMATVSQGIKMFSHAAQVEKEHQEALKQLALSKLEMQREYTLSLLKEQLYYKQGSNIFGSDQINGAVNSILTYRETIAKLKKEIQGEAPGSFKPSNIFNVKGELADYKKQVQAYNDGIGALANVDIVTGSRTSGWGFWKKRKDVYSGLLDTYDDIIDKEGKLNTNRIQAILNTHKMSDENKALLESLLSLDQAAKDAEEQLKNYLSQTFGGLGDALADSIVTAFHTGEDAAQLFKGNVTDMLDDLAKQMVFALYLKDTFDKLEKDIEKAYTDLADDKLTEEQLSHKITDILGGFFGGLGGDIENANKFLEEFWKNAEANGFDRPEGERQGAKGGFANASQDSINELTGGVYAVRQIAGDIRNDHREELLIHRTIMGYISVLVERSEYWEHLETLPEVVKKLEDIEAYGLKMKV